MREARRRRCSASDTTESSVIGEFSTPTFRQGRDGDRLREAAEPELRDQLPSFSTFAAMLGTTVIR